MLPRTPRSRAPGPTTTAIILTPPSLPTAATAVANPKTPPRNTNHTQAGHSQPAAHVPHPMSTGIHHSPPPRPPSRAADRRTQLSDPNSQPGPANSPHRPPHPIPAIMGRRMSSPATTRTLYRQAQRGTNRPGPRKQAAEPGFPASRPGTNPAGWPQSTASHRRPQPPQTGLTTPETPNRPATTPKPTGRIARDPASPGNHTEHRPRQ